MYAIGLDYGTNSVRAIVVHCKTGEVCGSGVYAYMHGEKGVIGNDTDPNIARQHPADYLTGLEITIKSALSEAGISGKNVIGIGVDGTASTPIPLDEQGQPLAFCETFKGHLAALAWLWKDHTASSEAKEITERAIAMRPAYIAACGGAYSAEWFWAKILHCARSSPDVFEATKRWIELTDYIPYVLTGEIVPGLCAAGHKGLYSPEWNGFADEEFLAAIDPCLVSVRRGLPEQAHHIGHPAGRLNAAWANRLGLKKGIPVAVGMIDAHAGAIGSGVKPGTMVKIMGTSTCDIAVASLDHTLPEIPGICGVAHESVLPGCYGLEAGQSAVGDIFNWFVHTMKPGGGLSHEQLNQEALEQKPGASGLLALDWQNGNRSTLTDSKLTGLILGLSLHSKPAEVFRALVEATAFGARVIVERYREYGVPIERIIACGGISQKSSMTMQIYADVLDCPMEVSAHEQSCALGAAMAGAVVGGMHANFRAAASAMTGEIKEVYKPVPENQRIYDRLFKLYMKLHDLFGTSTYTENQFELMKELLSIREEVRGG